jgi:(S)-2-hydroxyglutarate dehydrogenase
MRSSADVLIAGGGIVGLATAFRLTERHPGLRVVVCDKEPRLAQHQTGRNSGVLHSGVYYPPGSARAINCRAGLAQMTAFCDEEDVPYVRCGKVIVAHDETERSPLAAIEQRGRANGVAVERLDASGLQAVEPHASGVAALHVPEAGIVDYGVVAARLAERVRQRGGEVLLGTAVAGAAPAGSGLDVRTGAGTIAAGWLINCAGLHADRLALACGIRPPVRIVPFRGDYFTLIPEARHLCRGLIYPVPDRRFPFLGIHFSRRVDGRVDVGPSAVPAFAREGYRLATVRARDLAEMIFYPGFRRLARAHWRFGAGEVIRAISTRRYVRAASRLVPALRREHLRRGPSGVRAQALAPDGTLVDDFLFADGDRSIHVLSAASPAATASLNIGLTILERLEARW